jgi:hypothetical protein
MTREKGPVKLSDNLNFGSAGNQRFLLVEDEPVYAVNILPFRESKSSKRRAALTFGDKKPKLPPK